MDDPDRGPVRNHLYWPQERGVLLKVDHLATVEIISERRKVLDGFEVRARKFLFKNGLRERIVTQHHLYNWKEHGVVSPAALADFTAMVEVKGTKQPVIVHSRNGVGRSGTFIATYATYKRLLDGDKDPQLIENIVREMRNPEKGRNGMIQTPEQYFLIHEAIRELLDHIP